MDFKEFTQEDVIKAQESTLNLMNVYLKKGTYDVSETQELIKEFSRLVDLQAKFINQLIIEGQALGEALTGKTRPNN